MYIEKHAFCKKKKDYNNGHIFSWKLTPLTAISQNNLIAQILRSILIRHQLPFQGRWYPIACLFRLCRCRKQIFIRHLWSDIGCGIGITYGWRYLNDIKWHFSRLLLCISQIYFRQWIVDIVFSTEVHQYRLISAAISVRHSVAYIETMSKWYLKHKLYSFMHFVIKLWWML